MKQEEENEKGIDEACGSSRSGSIYGCRAYSLRPTGKPEETKKEETKAEGGETSAAADKEEAAAADGEVTLRFSWWGGDARHKATEAACQAFMEKYPNIKVECEYEAGTDGLRR